MANKEISAGGVVFRRNGDTVEIQMIRDRYGKMTLAKGKIEAGESLEQTALREIEEETGIAGRIHQKLETVVYQYEHPIHGTVDKEVHYYLVQAIDGQHKPQIEEIHGVEWVSPEEAWQRQSEQGYDNNDGVLRRALQLLGKEVIGR
ncbi:NUDIX hydrolase [Paenibacillus koleovorans]|uniref:NUDIX hydrolase n=1 Tax=Paenibacillus koleovorans TaxID=121608 RepID=UPI000FDB25BC|nr:NUDIX domain-containing protein [Paenibacillus koleovorans]